MSSFFEPPSRRPTEPEVRYRAPEWAGPPAGTIPGVVPVERVIAATDRVAVAITALEVYSTGLTFDVITVARPAGPGQERVRLHQTQMWEDHDQSEGLPDRLLRVGVASADGRRATNVPGQETGRPQPGELRLRSHGGGGSDERYRVQYWLWPLPPGGPLAIVCEWPLHGIPLTRIEIEEATIRDAVARATTVFTDEHLPSLDERPADEGGGWRGYIRG